MATTPHVGITLLEQAQAQKEITANTAFARIDALLNMGVIDKDLTTPPGSPSVGDVYLVGASATDAWAGKDFHITWYDQVWRFLLPNEGMRVWMKDEAAEYLYDGFGWVPLQRQFSVQTFSLAASDFYPSVSSGCAALASVSVGAGQPTIRTLDFDAGAVEYAEAIFPMPKRWDAGDVTLQLLWSHAAGASSYDVIWGAQAIAVGDADALAVSFPTGVEVSDSGGTGNTLYVSPPIVITPSGSPATEDILAIRIYRKGSDGSDTLNIDARLHGVRFTYCAAQSSDD